jgi:ketosteroid isomerase-like protein
MLAGDLAIETGTFTFTQKPKGSAAITDKGKYMTVWKKQADGSWKLLRDIANSDLPMEH